MKRPSQWETIRHDDILDCFPILSEEDIGDITLGKQLFFSWFIDELEFIKVFFNSNVLGHTLRNDAPR